MRIRAYAYVGAAYVGATDARMRIRSIENSMQNPKKRQEMLKKKVIAARNLKDWSKFTTRKTKQKKIGRTKMSRLKNCSIGVVSHTCALSHTCAYATSYVCICYLIRVRMLPHTCAYAYTRHL